MDIPTSTKSTPEIKFVKLIAFGEDNRDLIFATKSIIKIFPIIGTEKESSEIRQTSTSSIISKLKKPGRSVM